MSDLVMVPRAKLEQFRDAFAEELAAYDIDPPIHHLKQGHEDCVSLLAAPAVPAECCRNELLTALHALASNYENALGMFGQDGEGRRKAEGDLAHAMMVAARHNRNGPGCAAPAVPATPQGTP